MIHESARGYRCRNHIILAHPIKEQTRRKYFLVFFSYFLEFPKQLFFYQEIPNFPMVRGSDWKVKASLFLGETCHVI